MRTRYWLGIPALLLAIWLGFGDFHGDVDPAAEAGLAFAPRYRIEGLKLMRTDADGVPALQMVASNADYYDDGSAQLKTVEAKGLSGNAAPWQLQAPQGLVPAGQRRLKLLAPVTGTGRRLGRRRPAPFRVRHADQYRERQPFGQGQEFCRAL